MALAYLLSEYLKVYKAENIADSPSDALHAITIDHGMRRESSREAAAVATQIRKMDIRALVLSLNWSSVLPNDADPSQQPNVESLARTLRYRTIAGHFARQNVMSLFFGHHKDDQYETILMRLLAGHGYRGLQGIHAANAIPECYDIDRAYKSGLVDDQMKRLPSFQFSPPNKERKALRNTLKHESTLPGFEGDRSHLGLDDLSGQFPTHVRRDFDPNLPYLTPLNIEDGGITIYRPLLEFDKARLIATCEANNVPWFEDSTNTDPSLTTRNALRKMCREHSLPRALQKPAILSLATRSRRRVQEEEATASRLLSRHASIVDFDPNAGSLLVDLPPVDIGRSMPGRHRSTTRIEKHRQKQRVLAAIVSRKMIDFVTPDYHLPPISNLDNTVRRLFPHLYDDQSIPTSSEDGRKAFSIAGVQFEPVPSYKSTRWFLSRAPFHSTYLQTAAATPEKISRRPQWRKLSDALPWKAPCGPDWKTWQSAVLWDGRFWIRLSSRERRIDMQLAPLMPQHTKAFKAALPAQTRARFEKLLKYHAPGKTRYTLPGIYEVEHTSVYYDRTEERPRKMRLLALPTLGIHIADLEKWVQYDARYRNVDMGLLGSSKGRTAQIHAFATRVSQSRRKRKRRLEMRRGNMPGQLHMDTQ